jgi:ATPase subunit of ABC transporter with duplicated ATPase domains
VSGPLLVLDRVTAGYEEPVVGPVSFRLDAGDVVGLWGANGSGKSTLLRAVVGETRVFAGQVAFAPGALLAWQAQRSARLAEMPFDGRDYLRFAGAVREPPPRLSAWLRRRIDRLSGGQFQLLAIWAVLGTCANVVLLDEPTNNLDPAGQDVLADTLEQARGERAVLMVSHERDFLERTCSRVVELGRIEPGHVVPGRVDPER